MEFSHINEAGFAKMVDVSGKEVTFRKAVAEGSIRMKREVLEQIKNGGVRKGEVLNTALVAGISAAKRTWELIPMCHNIPLNGAEIAFSYGEGVLTVTATATADGKTGAEMEALTAVSVALLTVYDMIKSADKGAVMENIRLREKIGGKSGEVRYD